jgi:hypothetical protein
MLWVVAIRLPTSTVDVGEKYRPWAFVSTTCPGALMRPKIWLGLASLMRLSVTACALGWANCTCAALPRLKLSHWRMALGLLCCTSRLAACAVLVWLMLACPATSRPPVGNWVGAGGAWARACPPIDKLKATLASMPALLEATAWPERPLPALAAISGTAHQHWRATDHRDLKIRFMSVARAQNDTVAFSHKRQVFKVPSLSAPLLKGKGFSPMRRDKVAFTSSPCWPCQATDTPRPRNMA